MLNVAVAEIGLQGAGAPLVHAPLEYLGIGDPQLNNDRGEQLASALSQDKEQNEKAKYKLKEIPETANEVRAVANAFDASKGRKLEELVRYVFEKIPGVEFYKSNIINNPGSEEIDVASFNNKATKGFSFLENLLLVECKNWSSPVGANHVREFTTKLKHRACAYGVLGSVPR